VIIPIGDENPTSRRPYVNYTLLAVNIFIFVLAVSGGRGEIVREYGFVPNAPGLADACLSTFLHLKFLHLAGNMLFLWIYGGNVEDVLGPFLYLPFYLLAGGAATIAYWISASSSSFPCVGASGAIAGVLGFHLVFFPWRRIRFFYWFYFYVGTFRVAAVWGIGFWLALQFLNAFLNAFLFAEFSGVAYWAHIGGGLLFGLGGGMIWKFFLLRAKERLAPAAAPAGLVVTSPSPPAAAPTTARPDGASRRTDPNSVLAKVTDEAFFLATFARSARVHGEQRIAPEHHLRAITALSQQGRFGAGAATAEGFLAIYPDHADAPQVRYRLGLLHVRRLGRPGRGLKLLRRAVEEPGGGYALAEAQAELESVRSNLARITAGKEQAELVGPCAIIYQTDESADEHALAKVVAGATGRHLHDVLRELRAFRGFAARNLPPETAVAIAGYLQARDTPVIVLDATQFHPLLSVERATQVGLVPGGLRWKSATAEGVLRREEICVAAAGRLEAEEAEEVLERKGRGRRRIVGMGGSGAAPPAETARRPRTVRRSRFAIQAVVRETGFAVEFYSERTALGSLAEGQRRGEVALGEIAARILEQADLTLDRGALERLAAGDLGEESWRELTFVSEAALGEYATALYYRRRYG